MGRKRPRPERLGEKLLRIREALDLSQAQIVDRLGLKEMKPARISQYERNHREPSLPTLMAYAELAGVHLEDITNDNLDLPENLPANFHYRGHPRKPPS
ncbi:MAG TPA: helix-turn-helix transcriptional regulator [Pyrinomonadaceae bacterium]